MRQTAKSKYFVIPALLSLMAVITLVPAQAEDSEQGNSNDGNERSQIVPNTSEDRNAMGDSHMDTRVCPPAAPGEATCIAIVRDYFKRGVKIEQNATSATPNAVTPKLTLSGFNSLALFNGTICKKKMG
jgi:hypothetical protein